MIDGFEASLSAPPAQGECERVVYACPECGTGMEVDPTAKPAPAPLQVYVLSELADEIEATYPNADASNLRAFGAQPPAPGEAELPLGTDPVAWTFQHEDTGRMTTLENDGINNPENFVANNPRFVLCEPLYSAKQVREAVRAAIAALAQQRVPDAVHKAVERLKDRTFPQHECPAESAAVWNVALYELRDALNPQPEARGNGE